MRDQAPARFHLVSELLFQELFPYHWLGHLLTPPLAAALLRVDPDRIARRLPERPQYLEHNPDAASALMLPEAGFLQEVLQNFAMANKRSMVIDGSFSDAKVSSLVCALICAN